MTVIISEMPLDDTSNIYLELRDDYKPVTTDDAVWELVWSNFVGYVGETMESLQQTLTGIATSMSLAAHRSVEVEKYIRFLLNVADGRLTADDVINVQDLSTEPFGLLLSLDLQRHYSSVITKRRSRGVFGYGWFVPLL